MSNTEYRIMNVEVVLPWGRSYFKIQHSEFIIRHSPLLLLLPFVFFVPFVVSDASARWAKMTGRNGRRVSAGNTPPTGRVWPCVLTTAVPPQATLPRRRAYFI